MADGWSVLQGVITAGAGLTGVWWGGKQAAGREIAKEQARMQKEAIYLAILVSAHLDRFAAGCVPLAYDDGTTEGRPTNEPYYEATTTAPTFEPLALEVDWKSLPADLMYEILNLPYRAEELAGDIAQTYDYGDAPEYTEYFWSRQEGYAKLGLEVSDLARRLRQHVDLPQPTAQNGARRDEVLREQRDNIAEERRAFAERHAARMAAVPPPPPALQHPA